MSIIALLIRYLGIGFVATGGHYFVFLLLIVNGVTDPVLASVGGGVIGAIISYIGNRRLSFVATGIYKLQPIRFVLVSLATNIGNGVGMWVLIKFNLSPLVSQILVTLTALRI